MPRDERLWAYVEQALADVDLQVGRLASAADRLHRARDTHTRLGAGDGLAETLRSAGDLAASRGRHADAVAAFEEAIAVWRGIGATFEVANTLARLEHLHRETDAAATYGAECRNLLRDMDLDETSLYVFPASFSQRRVSAVISSARCGQRRASSVGSPGSKSLGTNPGAMVLP